MRIAHTVIGAIALAFLCGSCSVPLASAAGPEGIHKIQHVIMIMQENRSFDTYFGTYPGADGIPAHVCLAPAKPGRCVAPYHNAEDKNVGGPHGSRAATISIDGGRMDGFVKALTSTTPGCGKGTTPECSCKSTKGCTDVMGYHDAREISNYWAYAHNYVLQDRMFEPVSSWSLPDHLSLVSGWSAECAGAEPNPLSCVSTLNPPKPSSTSKRPWTDVTWLLHAMGVSWGYYVFEGTEPDCTADEAITCTPGSQSPTTPSIWNTLPEFTDVKADGQLGNIQSLSNFYSAAKKEGTCGLPNVSWVVPNGKVSEHPPAAVSAGQAYVSTLINSVMRSPCWGSTAIFVSWDDWGGFYDHVAPPTIDENGYGIRLPGLLISPYARAGYIDAQQLSHDSYLKFIEDIFLGGARLNPSTDGRPDGRPSVREEAPGLGDLASEFNFNQAPRSPLLLPSRPPAGAASQPPGAQQPPALETGAASSVSGTHATLNATVNPDGATVANCHFDYGPTTGYGSSAPCASAPGSGSTPVAVSAALAGLTASSTYHYRVVASNSAGTSTGPDLTLATTAGP